MALPTRLTRRAATTAATLLADGDRYIRSGNIIDLTEWCRLRARAADVVQLMDVADRSEAFAESIMRGVGQTDERYLMATWEAWRQARDELPESA